MVSEIERLADLVSRTHAGDAWHGPSVRDALDGISAADAAAHPIAGAHSIWEIVLHVTGWRHEVVKRIRGGSASLPEAGDWPRVTDPTPGAWMQTLERLDASHLAVLEAVRGLPPERLEQKVIDPRDRELGAGLSYALTLHGVVHHDVYHAGQISLLRKALQKT